MGSRVAVADAAPLIAFGRVGQLALLPRVFGDVLVPETVAAECLVPGMPGAPQIAQAFEAGQLVRHADVGSDPSAFPQLDAGESAAIHLALQTPAVLLIDERLGRLVARRLGLDVVGSLGVLIASKRLGFIDSMSEVVQQMRNNGYFIADALVREALQRAGE